jgi:hypothetical protein
MSWGQHHLMVVNVNTFIDRLTPITPSGSDVRADD